MAFRKIQKPARPRSPRQCAHVDCARWAITRGVCRGHYHSTLHAGLRAAAGDRLSPSLHPVRRAS